ncbi:glycoside hydrolase family 88 protein, partial [Bacillus pumilus]|uniref:glycoside hydrolase family 88 protein n=1 Tax=Bacillus pumilus TaxID=1408 RepID=UPI0021B2B914
MGGGFGLKYGKVKGEEEVVDMVMEEEYVMRKDRKDEKRGVYYEGWEEGKVMGWGDEKRGCCGEF